jgi:hypothetical protein
MRLFFRRCLPWLTAGLAAGFVFWQWQDPLDYPWPLVLFLLWYLLAVVILVWKRLSWRDAVEKTLPSFLTLMAIAFWVLLIETSIERLIILLLFVGIPYLVLELLFLLMYAPARYPVNGLSRVNIAFVPLTAFFLAATFDGLLVFLRLPWWVPVAVFTLVGGLLFLFTAHPTANRPHRWRWAVLGGIIGLHIGILELLLPVSMLVHGALGAFLLAFPLRLRRYAYQPVPSRRLAWSEGLLACLFFVGLLVVSRWI